jgi:hypothetical protein
MRFLLKISIPVEAGNAAAKDGFKAIQSILVEQKPEAAYFFAEGGKRTGFLVVDLQEASQVPSGVTPVEWTAEGLRLTLLSSDSFRS